MGRLIAWAASFDKLRMLWSRTLHEPWACHKKFEQEFHKHPGLLSLSTVRLPRGDFGNLVLFTDPAAKDQWNHSQLHYELVPEISPLYYQSIRLNNGLLPNGLESPDDMRLIRVKYLDYGSSPPWRAVRKCNDGHK